MYNDYLLYSPLDVAVFSLWLKPWVANVRERAASRSCGVLMYLRNAALCHLPRSWIVESSTPANAADVAAPILKLWPAYWSAGNPFATNTFRTSATNTCLANAWPSGVVKNGPGADPRRTM